MASRLVRKFPIIPFLRVATASQQPLTAYRRPLVVPLPISTLRAASFVSVSRGAYARRSSGNAVKAVENDDTESYTDVEDSIANITGPVNVVAVEDDDDMDDIQSVPWKVSSSVDRRPFVALQNENAINIRMDMPGICKENVTVYLDDKKLIIKGKYPKRSEASLDDEEDHIYADDAGSYYAEVDVPDNVNKEAIKTEMCNGVLVVSIPKEVTMIPVN